MRTHTIERTLSAQAARFPVLDTPEGRTPRGAFYVARNSGVEVEWASGLPAPAMLVQYERAWTILLSCRLPVSYVAPAIYHELAHLWLQHDGGTAVLLYGPSPIVEDPREAEADYLVSLIMGPDYLNHTVSAYEPHE